MSSKSKIRYNLVSSSSVQIVPFNLASGNFDQLKHFRGFEGLGIFFFGSSNLGMGGGGPHGNGGGPGAGGGIGGAAAIGGGGGGKLGFAAGLNSISFLIVID